MTTIRVVNVPTRLPGETGQQFIDRLLSQLGTKRNGHVASATATSETMGRKAMDSGHRPTRGATLADAVRDREGGGPVRKARRSTRVCPAASEPAPRSLGAAVVDERPTTKWPPQKGERYVGVWPPKAIYDQAKRTRELCRPMPKSTRVQEGPRNRAFLRFGSLRPCGTRSTRMSVPCASSSANPGCEPPPPSVNDP
jgi:hypothetical protein